ncbi:MAG: hypothetical protein GY951_13150 [Psychromonas sp.]|nr:hypothetical protein [Psychromonas sp.]
MIAKFALILVMLITLTACSVGSNQGIEQSIIFIEPKAQEYFVKKMDEFNYPYRIGEGGQVFYPFKNKKKVKELQAEVINIYHPPYAISSSNHVFISKVKEALQANGITYREIELSNETKISWDEKDDTQAKSIVRTFW